LGSFFIFILQVTIEAPVFTNSKAPFMKSTKIIHSAVGLSILLIGLYACTKERSSSLQQGQQTKGPTTAKIYLTDHQTPIFDSVFIDIEKLEVKVEDSNSTTDSWITLNIHAGVYNILRFRNGLDTLFANGALPNNQIRQIRLTLGTNNSLMKNSQSYPLKIKSDDRQVVANLDNTNFDVTGSQVFFWIDFDAGNSIRVDNSGSGNNNGFLLTPHIKIFTHSQSGRIEGKVFPKDADPIVKAITGSDTATAIPEREGESKIVGLNPGIYQVLIDAQNGYVDTTINNVVVRKGEETHLSAITLHK
jgi:hypothetical protein